MPRDVRRTRPLPHTVSVARPARGRGSGETVPSQPPAVLRRGPRGRANRDLPALRGTAEGPRPARERGGGPAPPTQASYRLLDKRLRRGEAQAIARSLGVTPQTVQGWCRPRGCLAPTGTDRSNPLDAIQGLVATWVAREGTLSRGQGLAQRAAQRGGGLFVPDPGRPPGDLQSSVGRLRTGLRMSGDLLARVHASGGVQRGPAGPLSCGGTD